MAMDFQRPLPSAEEIIKQYPLDAFAKEVKQKRDKEIADIFEGKSDKHILIIGPCSADREDSVMDYLYRLSKVAEQVKDKLVIVPRVYTNKPRTLSDGYMGMLHQPDPDKSTDLAGGIVAIRKLHMRALVETSMSCADEMLYPSNYPYLADLLSYNAVGARSVENQEHRLVASGLDSPVGMKNPTGGDLTVMMNAIYAAQHSHDFAYHGWQVHSTGNPHAHAILRGYVDIRGESIPNYHYEDLERVVNLFNQRNLKNPAIIVDCNHCNSNKNALEQPRIAMEIINSCRHNSDIAKMTKGLMVESYLVDGAQKTHEVYGKSITDACIGWEKSEILIKELAEKW